MSRVLQSILAVALFVGIGFGTRHAYRQWITSVIKESEANVKETAKWQAVKGNFSDVKFDKPINSIPTIEYYKPPTERNK